MKPLIIDSHLTKATDTYSEMEGMGGIASSLIYLSDSLAAEGHEVLLAIAGEPGMRRSGAGSPTAPRSPPRIWPGSRPSSSATTPTTRRR